MYFVSKLNEGFFVVELKELYNQVCKCAIKEARQFKEEKKSMENIPGPNVGIWMMIQYLSFLVF